MYKKFIKRILDVIMATILIILLLPIFIIISIAIKLETKGPVIFKQIRSGKHNKEFTLYKFRSMTANNDFYNTKEEDQITKVGRVLRKTSLDEIPEFINILKGDMSFVGPRPLLVEYLPYYTEEEHHRHDVRPGLTGLAQVSGRNLLNWDDRFKKDIEYVNNVTFMNDFKIVFKTISIVLKREGISDKKTATMTSLIDERKKKDVRNK